jgi:hypothetical protein
VNQYDHYLRGYQAAAIQTERLSALLNAGQSVILSAGEVSLQCFVRLILVAIVCLIAAFSALCQLGVCDSAARELSGTTFVC